MKPLAACLLAATLSISVFADGDKRKSSPGRPVLWVQPSAARLASLATGPGGTAGVPKPPFRFIKEEKSGTSPKVWVKDAAGRTWIAKFGSEKHADTFGSRMAWALGYYASPVYFVPGGRITGMTDAGRSEKYIRADGSFAPARFEQVEPGVEYISKGWDWAENPFVNSEQGRNQLNGLKILMLLLSNWDGKDKDHPMGSNSTIFRVTRPGGTVDYYAIDDWGASLGAWGRVFTREKWDCEKFSKQSPKFIEGTNQDGEILWGYSGTAERNLRERITPADARWLLRYLGQMTDAHLHAGLRSAGADEAECRCFVPALRDRIRQLQQVAGIREARPPRVTRR